MQSRGGGGGVRGGREGPRCELAEKTKEKHRKGQERQKEKRPTASPSNQTVSDLKGPTRTPIRVRLIGSYPFSCSNWKNFRSCCWEEEKVATATAAMTPEIATTCTKPTIVSLP